MKTCHIASVDEMNHLASQVAEQLQGGDVLLLTGELGSGKTTFVQGLASTLDVREHVTSPSFTIAAEYGVPRNKAISQLVHVDLYRLDKVSGEDAVYIQEVFRSAKQQKRVIVVEWADRLGSTAPLHAWRLEFSHGEDPNERAVVVSPPLSAPPVGGWWRGAGGGSTI